MKDTPEKNQNNLNGAKKKQNDHGLDLMHIELARMNTFLAVMEKKKAENLAKCGFFLTVKAPNPKMKCLWCHLKLNLFINSGYFMSLSTFNLVV